jgi:molybdopterin-guanine dinucleotide biosynthesis protein A
VIVHGFVQAGGGSTRFGTDKALVKLAGKTMLQRTGELLTSVCDDVTVVAQEGKYADASWPLLADRWPGEGPLGGILTALTHLNALAMPRRPVSGRAKARAQAALILSCDMPFLTTEFLFDLCDRASRSSAFVVLPQSADGLEPLCACWNFRALAPVQAAFDSGVRKVTGAIKHLSTEVLDESVWKRFDKNNRLFWNMNTPADYDEARRLLEAPEA